MYADDTLLIEKGKTQELSSQSSQKAMNEVHAWCVLNRLTVNIDKTKVMIIAPNCKTPENPTTVKISNVPLKTVCKYEYLGVLLDDKLNMNSHIDHVVKKVQSKYIYILRKIRKHISEKTALNVSLYFIESRGSGLTETINKLGKPNEKNKVKH